MAEMKLRREIQAGFPVTNKTLRRVTAANGKCPECGNDLDTGWECDNCGFDARPEAYSDSQRRLDQMFKEP